MLPAIFVDRPRLAIVIAIVTTIAGALALYTIPIAQYPDIVPLQVSVTTRAPIPRWWIRQWPNRSKRRSSAS
jgi:multidrug efflux pump subunit AcrB